MPSAENSIVINKPVAEVFAFVADHENDPKWRPGVNDIKHASGEGVGTVYRQGMKGPFGRRIPAYQIWQLRVRKWRVLYAVVDEIVYVVRVVEKGRKTTDEALA